MTLYEAVRALFRWSPLLVIPSRCIVIIYTQDIAHKEHNFQLRVSYPYTTLIYFSKPTTETPDMSRPSISIIYIVSAKLVHRYNRYIGQRSLTPFYNRCFDFNWCKFCKLWLVWLLDLLLCSIFSKCKLSNHNLLKISVTSFVCCVVLPCCCRDGGFCVFPQFSIRATKDII